MVWNYRVANHRFYGIVFQEYDQKEHRLVDKAEVIFKGEEPEKSCPAL